MKWTTAIALTLILGLVAVGVGAVLTKPAEDPQTVLNDLQRDYLNGLLDHREALDRLGEVLADKSHLDEPETAVRLLRARALVYRRLGAISKALEDLQEIRGRWAADSPELNLLIAELQAEDGQVAEALANARRVLRNDDTRADAWALAGLLEARLSGAARDDVVELTTSLLDRASGIQATALIDQLVVRDDDDPRLPALRGAFARLLRDKVQVVPTDVDEALGAARQAASSSRAAIARSLELAPSARSLVELSRSLASVGRGRDAADLLLSSFAAPGLEDSVDLLQGATPLLESIQRLKRIVPPVLTWDWLQLGAEPAVFEQLCRALYGAGLHGALGVASSQLARVGGKRGRYWATFYSNANVVLRLEARYSNGTILDAAPREQAARAAAALRSFGRRANEELPFPEARADAFFMAARAQRMLNNLGEERRVLSRALEEEPTGHPEAYLRRADLNAGLSSSATANIERDLSMAMNGAPRLTDELFDRWLEASEQSLARDGLDFNEIFTDATSFGQGEPLRPVGPATLWRIARGHLEQGRGLLARRLADKLLSTYPQLVPALDIKISSQLEYAGRFEVARDILDRIELKGTDDAVEGFLAALPVPIEGPLLERAILADPERFGRPSAAALALDEGDAARAASLLADVPAVEHSPAVRLLRGRARLESGQSAAAAEDLELLLDEPSYAREALLLLTRAAAEAGQRERLDELVRQALQRFTDPATLLAFADVLSAQGLTRFTQRILTALDRSPETRTPAYFRALVLYAAQTRDVATLAEATQRAGAYVEDGTVELGEILRVVRDRDWTRLPVTVERLRETTTFTPTPLQDAVLTLLEEELAAGRQLAERGQAAEPRSPLWALVRAAAQSLERSPIELSPWFGERAVAEAGETLSGSRRGRRDPRELLVALLVAELPHWRPWLIGELDVVERQGGGVLWPRWLRIHALLADGRGDRATPLREELAASFPDFGPLLDLDLQEAQRAHAADPLAAPLLQARVRRLQRLGARKLEDPIDVALARASELVLQQKPTEAFAELGPALSREGREDFEAFFLLGALLMREGQAGLAVRHLEQAAADAPPLARAGVADALVAALQRASDASIEQRAPLTPDAAAARLEQAARTFPRDPLVALAALRATQRLGPAAGQPAALGRLRLGQLRRAAPGEALEDLRRGSTRAWVEWSLEHAPSLAEDILAMDLELRPGDVELWSTRAEVLAQTGDEEAAARLYRVILEVEPNVRALHARAVQLIDAGERPNVLNPILALADRLGDQTDRARSALLRARLPLANTAPDLQGPLDSLERYWGERETLPDALVFDLGLALTTLRMQAAATPPSLRRERGRPSSRPDGTAFDPAELAALEAELAVANEAIAAENEEKLQVFRAARPVHAAAAIEVLDVIEPLAASGPDTRLLKAYRGLANAVAGAPGQP